jgi:TonB family protein
LENSTKPGATAVTSESKPNQNPRSNPVCLEVGVTVRSLPGEKSEPSSSHAEPAREQARTVIVFDNGAVLRLAGNFLPGQSIILSNAQGRDVVCRVANSRNTPNVKGYIELEFLEATSDFWGLHKPEAQPPAANPAAAVAAEPPVITPPQIAANPSVPEASAVAVASLPATPTAPQPMASTGLAPSFEDIAGVVKLTDPPKVRAKAPEAPSRIPAPKPSNDSKAPVPETARTYSPPGTSAPAAELTSLSANWDGAPAPAPARKPSAGKDVLGKFSHVGSEPTSSNGTRVPLVVGAAAVILLAIGAGIFFMRRADSDTPSVAPVAAVSQPAPQVPPPQAAPPSPAPTATLDQADAEPPSQVLPLSPAIATTATAPKEVAAVSTPSLPQSPRRQADNAPAAHLNPSNSQQASGSISKPLVPRSLKMSTPTVDNASGRLVDSSVPNIDNAVSTAGGVPGAGLLAVSHPNAPPPPSGIVGASPSGKIASEPKLISSTRPVYPQVAKQTNVEGDVILAVDIDASGNVVAAKPTAGPMYLRQAAVDAVRNWKYEPANLNGKPTSAQISVKIQFRLK